MKSILFKLFAYPVVVFVFWILISRILTLIVTRQNTNLLSFSLFNYFFLSIPFLIASSLFWFNQKPLSAFILGTGGGLLVWFLLEITFILSGGFNFQFNMLGLVIFTSISSGGLAGMIAFIKEKLTRKDPPPSSFVPL